MAAGVGLGLVMGGLVSLGVAVVSGWRERLPPLSVSGLVLCKRKTIKRDEKFTRCSTSLSLALCHHLCSRFCNLRCAIDLIVYRKNFSGWAFLLS